MPVIQSLGNSELIKIFENSLLKVSGYIDAIVTSISLLILSRPVALPIFNFCMAQSTSFTLTEELKIRLLAVLIEFCESTSVTSV